MRPSRRNEIIAAAIREASRHGVSGSTVRGIAAEAVYRVFGIRAGREEMHAGG